MAHPTTAQWRLKTYNQKLAYVGQRDDEAAQAARQLAAQRRAAKRQELQPEYDAVSQWQDEQIAQHGLTSNVIAATQAKIDALDAIVANA